MSLWRPFTDVEESSNNQESPLDLSLPRDFPRSLPNYTPNQPSFFPSSSTSQELSSSIPQLSSNYFASTQILCYPQLPIPLNEHCGFYPTVEQVSPENNSSGISSLASKPAIGDDTMAVSPQAVKRPFIETDVDYLSDDPNFMEYERNAVKIMAEKNGGSLVANNPRMRRNVNSNNLEQDNVYRRQREKNNYAAKQSRDKRKWREIHMSLKVSYLKREVAALKASLSRKACVRCKRNCLCN